MPPLLGTEKRWRLVAVSVHRPRCLTGHINHEQGISGGETYFKHLPSEGAVLRQKDEDVITSFTVIAAVRCGTPLKENKSAAAANSVDCFPRRLCCSQHNGDYTLGPNYTARPTTTTTEKKSILERDTAGGPPGLSGSTRHCLRGLVQIIHRAAQMRRPCFVMEISGKSARDLCLRALR